MRADYLKARSIPEEDTLEHIRISTQVQMIADEIISVKKSMYRLLCLYLHLEKV